MSRCDPNGCLLFRHELVDGCEYNAAAHPVQQLAQMLAPAGLHRRVAEDVRAALELAKKLVVEIVAVHFRSQNHAFAENGDTILPSV